MQNLERFFNVVFCGVNYLASYSVAGGVKGKKLASTK